MAATLVISVGTAGCEGSLKPQHSTVIVTGALTIKPGDYVSYPVTVSTEATGARVVGSFEASGGSGDDIKVFVSDEPNFDRWRNEESATFLYHSDQVKEDAFDVGLPQGAGSHLLVYENTFSVFSEKVVRTHVELKYRL